MKLIMIIQLMFIIKPIIIIQLMFIIIAIQLIIFKLLTNTHTYIFIYTYTHTNIVIIPNRSIRHRNTFWFRIL